jgi:hypothetical protein
MSPTITNSAFSGCAHRVEGTTLRQWRTLSSFADHEHTHTHTHKDTDSPADMARVLAIALIAACVALAALVSPAAAASKPRVHLVPHTHDDVGWLKTVDQLQYGLNMTIQPAWVNAILDGVVGDLSMNPDRRFTYVETAFFWRWWRQQNSATHDVVRKLVREGRLQFANGAWCMPDEAAPHFVDLIDALAIGHRFLRQEVNASVKVGWQIDPFGHSSFTAVLNALAGFNGFHYKRVDFRDYDYRAPRKMREQMWQGSRSLPQATLLAGSLLFQSYGPPSGFHWDLQQVVVDLVQNRPDDFIVDDADCEQFNVPQIVDRFVAHVMAGAEVTLGVNQMFLMGSDFNYVASSSWFVNLDKLVKAVNADGRVEALYSTPFDYTAAKIAEVGAANFPKQTHDVFPYADGPHAFWTGYFTSRAALKRYVRSTSIFWTAARQMLLLAGQATGEVHTLADALGIAQHHDAVAGTAKQHVAFDYAKRLAKGVAAVVSTVSNHGSASFNLTAGALSNCARANESVCAATAGLRRGGAANAVGVVVWNAAPYARAAWVSIPCPHSDCAVAAGDGLLGASHTIQAPRAVTNYRVGGGGEAQPFSVLARVKLPPAGYAVVYVGSRPQQQHRAAAAEHRFRVVGGAALVTISNERLSLAFDSTPGVLVSATDLKTGVTLGVTQDWCTYDSNNGDSVSGQRGGAYIFRSAGGASCVPVMAGNGSQVATLRIVHQSRELSVVEQDFGWVVQRVTLAAGEGASFGVEFTVLGLHVDIAQKIGRELMARFRTNVSSGSKWYTDSNGRDFQERVRNFRFEYPFEQTENVSGNFVPVNAGIFINDTNAALGVVVDASVAGASLHDGELMLLVHRRLLVDDSRGVTEPLNETEHVTSYAQGVACDIPLIGDCGRHFGAPLIVRGRLRVTLSTPSARVVADVRNAMEDGYFGAPQLWFFDATRPAQGPIATFGSILAAPLPAQLQLVTVQLIDKTTLLVRLGHKFGVEETTDGSTPAAPASVSLRRLLSPLALRRLGAVVSDIREFTINAVDVVARGVDVVTVAPMELRTFIFTLARSG